MSVYPSFCHFPITAIGVRKLREHGKTLLPLLLMCMKKARGKLLFVRPRWIIGAQVARRNTLLPARIDAETMYDSPHV